MPLTADVVRAVGPEFAASIVAAAGAGQAGALVKALDSEFVAALVIELGVGLNTHLVGCTWGLDPTLLQLCAALRRACFVLCRAS